jgi:hypothetical protein
MVMPLVLVLFKGRKRESSETHPTKAVSRIRFLAADTIPTSSNAAQLSANSIYVSLNYNPLGIEGPSAGRKQPRKQHPFLPKKLASVEFTGRLAS